MAQRRLIWFSALLVASLALLAFISPGAGATVDYARQTGQPCPVCHVRPEGGGELTPTGAAYARGGYEWPPEPSPEPYAPSNLARTVKLVVGYIHLTTAVLWFGTIFYIHVVVRPQSLTTGIPKTERLIGWVSIAIMAGTGIVLTIFRHLETRSVFAGAFGTVLIIKLAQFTIMVCLAAVATLALDPRMRRRSGTPEPPSSTPHGLTAESLALFDGKEGHRGLVAVAGKVYDVTQSKLWRDGVHLRRHHAGQDLSEALREAPHGDEVLQRVPMVGGLTGQDMVGAPRRPAAHRIFVKLAYVNLVLLFGILLCVAWWKWGFVWRTGPQGGIAPDTRAISEQSSRCISCHSANTLMRAQIAEWEQSDHAVNGVACYECHRAEDTDPDVMDHNGYAVSVLVTPKDCSGCHVNEAEQFASSRHSLGGDILDSLDNVLGERVEGVAATVLGCQQCHGAPVEVLDDGTLSPASWPNTGIGRINPDGSRGACSTCHMRHLFSVAVAREPSSCGNCHLGPDHPQKEIYEESKHGIAFVANRERMALDAVPWVLGQDYSAAPTCATCHMSALPKIALNHDVGQRIAWTLRPPISVHLEDWEQRRADMKHACQQCHSPGFYENFFIQFDDAVQLYNEKFAAPAGEIMQKLRQADRLTDLDFDEPIEWTYYLLWHHEGRRARHGAAMMGPDYVQWHGFFEVADRFYNEFVPQAEELLPGVTESLLAESYHRWRQSPR